eukprot:TRINITY_DN8784_c0_g1_i1.p1 TRINITY_DN8784_c0_g1~~TRINITY_DN8784_c0_g1_i1.p1  ORF type:complete len:363 (-),score=84.90 TRINITY_DN8784_c0_g1_i1:2-1027(-)
MSAFFRMYVTVELQMTGPEKQLETLSPIAVASGITQALPSSACAASHLALAHYHSHEFDTAERLFEELQARDPCRLEHLDTFSNILYIRQDRVKLSRIAHRAVQTEKYRPETCCVVGNYFSSKGEHERAIQYFQRALRLNRRFASAWTLTGHEYLELKNCDAAIDAYRRAVDVAPRDYRAWYGLGQAYELLKMHNYSLHYFRKAALLRPRDARMWCAVAQAYVSLDRFSDAIRCFLRAHAYGDQEGTAVLDLAKLLAHQGEKSSAAYYYKLVLDGLPTPAAGGQGAVLAIKYLAQYFLEAGNLSEAEHYALMLHDQAAKDRDDGRQLLKQIQEARAAAPPS